MLENKELIIEWLIKESGSTFMKESGEFQASLNILKEATTYPYRMEGKILTSQTAGKENRVNRNLLGVIGIISPWNFPFHLAFRPVHPSQLRPIYQSIKISKNKSIRMKAGCIALILMDFLINELPSVYDWLKVIHENKGFNINKDKNIFLGQDFLGAWLYCFVQLEIKFLN